MWKARKCTTILCAVFVDQIKPLLEPIPISLCYIGGQSASMLGEKEKKKEKPTANVVPKLINNYVPLVQSELVATRYP